MEAVVLFIFIVMLAILGVGGLLSMLLIALTAKEAKRQRIADADRTAKLPREEPNPC